MKKNLTKISDLDQHEISKIIKQAFLYKEEKDQGQEHKNILKKKTIAMIFEKASLRTKASMETAAYQLGGHAIYLSSSQILASGNNQQGRESVPDIAHNLERFCEVIAARVYQHKTVQTLASSSSKPVINLLCDQHHPTQTLADLMVIYWHKKSFKNIKVCFIGDSNNVSQDLMQGCSIMGIDFSIATPKNYPVPEQVIKETLEYAKKSGAKIEVTNSPEIAIKNADFVYTDTFISMGEENQYEQKIQEFSNYQINARIIKQAKNDVKFMHCLPAHRGEEVTDEIMDSKQSIVFDQAECRLHIMKSLLHYYFT